MKFCLHTLLTILLCLSSRFSSVEIRVTEKHFKIWLWNKLQIWGNVSSSHSFDRFYVVTKFILPTIDDLRLSPIGYNKECKYI